MLDRDVLATVAASKRITAEDVLALRRSVYSDGLAEAGEVDRLFSIDGSASEHDPAWCEFFAEAVADFIVNQVEPEGYVSDENAAWLMARIAADGLVKSATELHVLIKVLEQAKSSPERLSAFALLQVKKAVVDGEGPLAGGGRLDPGRISRDEVELIRRILYAVGGDGAVAVTRAEAELLFDINDAVIQADNDPAWSELFVKAIGNFLMAASGYVVPTRQEAIQRESWLDEPARGVADFIGRMVRSGPRKVAEVYRQPSTDEAWAARNLELRSQSSEAESITAGEAEWLARRIGRDGALHPNEIALLRFIRDQAPSVHPSLQSLIAKAA